MTFLTSVIIGQQAALCTVYNSVPLLWLICRPTFITHSSGQADKHRLNQRRGQSLRTRG